ncbi:MAG: hypothetical protein KH120_01270 [Eubacterium sp.]|nr:hypothetical protein [Eubacterium sp.]
MLDLEYLNRFGKDLVSETDRLLQVKSAYEEINPEVLYKAELTEDGRNIGYTAFENVPGLKDIATDTSDFIKSQIGKYLEDKSSNLRECITAMVEDITGSMDPKPADSKSRVKECSVDEDPVIHPVSQTVVVDCASKISAVELSPSKSKVSPSQVEDKPKTSAAKPRIKATKKTTESKVKPDKKAKTVGKANTPS